MTSRDLQDRRHALGLTQEQLAKRLGVHRMTIHDWEVKHTPPPMTDLALRWLEHESDERLAKKEAM